MATDLEQRIREAVVAILTANAAVQTASGGTVRVVDRYTAGPAVTLPAFASEVASLDEASGAIEVRLTAIADAADAASVARHMLEAAKGALDYPAFAAQGLEVVPLEGTRTNALDAGDVREWVEGSPNLRQADWSLPLLFVE